MRRMQKTSGRSLHVGTVLAAAMELMQEDDPRRASVDRISERSGVSKATIHKWWPSRTAVAFAKALAMACMAGA
jgi:AcrR family transcriptional regulator